MTPENFVYWLQGFLEIENPTTIRADKVQVIKDHLQLVFKKETPTRRPGGILQDVHPFTIGGHWHDGQPNRNGDIYPRVVYPDGPIASC